MGGPPTPPTPQCNTNIFEYSNIGQRIFDIRIQIFIFFCSNIFVYSNILFLTFKYIRIFEYIQIYSG